MTVELDEVRGFLADHEPFAYLPEATLDALPGQMGIIYVRRGDEIVPLGSVNDTLYVIRSGAVDIVSEDELLLDRRDAGRNFGYSTLVGEPESLYRMVAVEDSLLLTIPRATFTSLIDDHPDLERYFTTQSHRVRAAADEIRDDATAEVLRTPIAELISSQSLLTCAPETTVQEAATLMTAGRVSSIIVVDGEAIVGILTDKDLRTRVVAEALPVQTAVSEVMTTNPRTIDASVLTFEAMLVMSELGVHHLPVIGATGSVDGILTSGDIFRQLQTDPIYLAADLARADLDELSGAFERAGEVASKFLDRGASAEEAHRLMSSVADTIARRLIELAEEKFGPAPIPYAFVAVGSQGRKEMGPGSDQDNALVLDDSFDEAAHGQYFADFTRFVCEGLGAAGQKLCPGDMMASNPSWRMTASQWNDTFTGWVTAPEAEALLNAQIFFDMRAIAGDESLAEQVHENAVRAAARSRRLHAHLAALSARREPPIGFFRGFVVERSGDYASTLDIKKGGTAAIVQMARLYAIVAGQTVVDTRARLEAASGDSVSTKGASELLDAFAYLQTLTVRHQAAQVRAGETPDYRIEPSKLSSRDRDNLRDAFGVVKSMQNALASKYPVRTI
ncbi:DUF294 nucleotidyltransferase-like domain-containing protein [Corynebacterium pilosum]|uniref:Signal transduction protein n=1 Tax=Corynebacterium pilosum TaxID=35756 RepID=A0A376CPD1_9CORY|nr:DUF294 nucleotidyltransferase-like domain-containing protein [Corynebacterium pilosum]STC70290.1 signal transduction protein [Corynebacterium pilosum]